MKTSGTRPVNDPFPRNLRRHFAEKLGDALACETPEHWVCYISLDGNHQQVSEEGFAKWVLALCEGHATLAHPPTGLELSTKNMSQLSTPLSEFFPVECSPSLFSTPSSWNNGTEACSSLSSGVPGPGYIGGKALKWLGQKSLRGIQEAIILARFQKYRRITAKWVLSKGDLSEISEENEIYHMLGDMLELTTRQYPERIQIRASETLNKVFSCNPSAFGPLQISMWLVEFNLEMRCNELAPPETLQRLEDILSKIPLARQTALSSSLFITEVCRYLMHKPLPENEMEEASRELYTWRVVRILSDTGYVNELSENELYTLQELGNSMSERYPCTAVELRNSWYYELDIFIECARRIPSFKKIIEAPTGMPFLLQHIKSRLLRRRSFEIPLAFLMDRISNSEKFRLNNDMRYSCLDLMVSILRLYLNRAGNSRIIYLTICTVRFILLSASVSPAIFGYLVQSENRLLLTKIASH
ncbi:hypothetical protein M422DRAFT_778095, partial [Sphaerobolus stellatus SS14]